MDGFLCPFHQEVALEISPFAGIGITWNSPFRGQVRAAFPLQVRAAFPLSVMLPLKHKSQSS